MMPVDVVVLIGQSNAEIAATVNLQETIGGVNLSGSLINLACEEASYNLGLGFNGIVCIARNGDAYVQNPNGDYSNSGTMFAGTPLLSGSSNYNGPFWYNYGANGVPVYSNLEAYFAQYLNYWKGQNIGVAPNYLSVRRMAIISAHNETDELNPKFINDTANANNNWANAVFAQRQDVANVFGLQASSIPMSFIWVPYNYATPGGAYQATNYGNTANMQSGGVNRDGYTISQYELQVLIQALTNNKADNMYWAGEYGDASMRGAGIMYNNNIASSPDTGVNGNQHYLVPSGSGSNGNDFQPGGGIASYVTRLARHIAFLFAADAQPGSIYASNNHMDQGPVAQSAVIVNDGTRTKIDVTFSMDSLAASFMPLGGAAQMGAGWAIMSPGTYLPNRQNYASNVSVNGNSIRITFANSIPSGQTLFYQGIGDGHITFVDYYDTYFGNPGYGTNPGFTEINGQGSAVYDSQGMPILVNKMGLAISG